jgi:hypothetical protein
MPFFIRFVWLSILLSHRSTYVRQVPTGTDQPGGLLPDSVKEIWEITMRKPTKKTTAIMVAAVTVLAAGGAAFAYWTAGGSGTGSATTSASTANVTVVQTSTVASMQPGDSAQTLSGNFNNPNSGPAYVGTVTAAIGSVTKAGGAPAGTCDETDYTLAGAAMTVNTEVPAGNGVGSWSGATIKFNNKATNQNQCKGATVNLTYTVS